MNRGPALLPFGIVLLALSGCGDPSPAAPTSQPPSQTPGGAPVAVLSLSIDALGSQEAVAAVSEVAVDASASTGTALRYRVDFGDGQASTDRLTRHVYNAPGKYTVTVSVTDDTNRTATATGEVAVASPLGTWVHSSYFARLNRVEVRSLSITAQDGNAVRGVLTKDSVSKTPFAGSIGADRRMRLVLEGSAESLEGLLPSMLSTDRAAWASSLRGGSLDGDALTFRRVVGEPSGTLPDSSLRMRFGAFGAPFAVKQISQVLFDAAASRGEGLTYYIEFGDGQVSTDVAPTHVIDRAGSYDARLTVVDRFGRSNSEVTPYRVRSLVTGISTFWIARNDECGCLVTLVFGTQEGTTVTGSITVSLLAEWETFVRSKFAGSVNPNGAVQLVLAGANVTMSGTLVLPKEPVGGAGNLLTLTFQGGPHHGHTMVLHLHDQ
jgi:PKD repeat protein